MRQVGAGSGLLPSSRGGRLSRSRILRRVATLVLTPIRFSLVTGHARSSWVQVATGADGNALPWISYPAIDLLANASLMGRRVLEFGAGQSTLWWTTQGVQLSTLESDAAWYQRVSDAVDGRCDVRLVDESLADFPEDLARERYDVIVIDGLRRQAAAQYTLRLLRPDGCVIQDNSEG